LFDRREKAVKVNLRNAIVALFFVLAVVLLVGCGAKDDGTRFVPVSYFDSLDSNAALVEEIADYDQVYFAAQISEYDIPTINGVIYGYSKNEDTGEVGLKLSSLAPSNRTVERLNAAAEGFSSFLPRLVELHIAHRPLIASLEEVGRAWLYSFSAESVGELCRDETEFRLSELEYEKLKSFFAFSGGANGTAQIVEFEKGQYYEATDYMPETVSLFYMTKFEKSPERLTRLDMSRAGEEWCVRSVHLGTNYQYGNNPKPRRK
jgi:hypothetical protein